MYNDQLTAADRVPRVLRVGIFTAFTMAINVTLGAYFVAQFIAHVFNHVS